MHIGHYFRKRNGNSMLAHSNSAHISFYVCISLFTQIFLITKDYFAFVKKVDFDFNICLFSLEK